MQSWLQSALPTITGDFTWIDGHDINNVCVCVRIDGLFMYTGNGFTVDASYVTISNLKIVNIPGGSEDISIIALRASGPLEAQGRQTAQNDLLHIK